MFELVAFALSLALVLGLMPGFIKLMHSKKMLQPGYALGPDSFKKDSQKPPNMGGLVVAGSITAVGLAFAVYFNRVESFFLLGLASWGALAVGFADDYIKNTQKSHEGLLPRYKLIAQTVLGLVLALWCGQRYGTAISLPFMETKWDMGYFYVPIMVLLYIFITNSSNLQDGVDGILGSVSAVGALAFSVICGCILHLPDISIPMASLAGACIAFLFFNWKPARIYMGDTGSMFVGGLFTGAALMSGLQFWLIPLCLTMILSSLSVIIQRLYYKLTHGKRIFLMSPIHHHFQKKGMEDQRIVISYAILEIFASLVAVIAAWPLLK